MNIMIAVRMSGGTYVARTKDGPKATASCTESQERAARRCAEKALGKTFSLKPFEPASEHEFKWFYIADDGKPE